MKATSQAGKPTTLPGGRVLAGALSVCALLSASAGGAAASIPQSAVYDVQIQGAVNGLPFARAGNMAIGPTTTAATTNGVNPIDLCLGSGSPFISPERGAIRFATNGICVNASGARQDMAFVTANQAASTVTIRPDPALSATGINGFNGSSGFTAAVWQIFDGTLTLQFQGRGETVTGTMQLLGTGAIFHSENTYNATLTGQARQLTPAADVAEPPPPRPDTTGPVVVIPRQNKTLTATSAGVVPFRLGGMLEDTTGIISLKTARKVQAAAKAKLLALGTRSFQALKGQKPIVRIKLNARAKRTLKKRKKLKVQATITLRDAASNETIKTYRFTLKTPKAKTKKR